MMVTRTFFDPVMRTTYSCFCQNMTRLGESVEARTRRPRVVDEDMILVCVRASHAGEFVPGDGSRTNNIPKQTTDSTTHTLAVRRRMSGRTCLRCDLVEVLAPRERMLASASAGLRDARGRKRHTSNDAFRLHLLSSISVVGRHSYSCAQRASGRGSSAPRESAATHLLQVVDDGAVVRALVHRAAVPLGPRAPAVVLDGVHAPRGDAALLDGIDARVVRGARDGLEQRGRRHGVEEVRVVVRLRRRGRRARAGRLLRVGWHRWVVLRCWCWCWY